MKRLLILLFILLANIDYSEAGRSLYLDFESKDSYFIPMIKSDRIYFEFDGDNHTIILDDIKDKRVEFDIFMYQEKNKYETSEEKKMPVQYVFLDVAHILKLDLNRDDIHDFEIGLKDFDRPSGKALVTFKRIEEKSEYYKPINKNIEEGAPINKNTWLVAASVILVIFILIVIGFIKTRKDNQKKGVYY